MLSKHLPKAKFHTHLLFVLFAWATLCVSTTIASADYPEVDGSQLSNENGDDASAANDDFFDPIRQQQEVESSERRNRITDADTVTTEIPPLAYNYSQWHTPAEHNEDYSRKGQAVQAKSMASGSTLMPEYVRRAKAESEFSIPVQQLSRNRETDADNGVSTSDSGSDYTDDESLEPDSVRQITQKYPYAMDANLPYAMKFYHDQRSEAPASAHDWHAQLSTMQQQLPLRGSDSQFQQQHRPAASTNFHDSNEDYYSDSEEYPSSTGSSSSSSSSAPTDTVTTNAPLVGQASPPHIPTSFGLNANEHQLIATSPEDVAGAVTTSSPQPNEVETARKYFFGTAADAVDGLARTILPALATTPALPPTPTPTSAPAPAPASTSTSTSAPLTAIEVTTNTGESSFITTTATATTTASTLSRPAGKQGKQIKISRRKLLPHEQLRNYIEDAYIRMPLAVIVDPSAESLEKTKTLWRDALRMNLNIKIVLVSLNATGTPAAYNFNNTRQFLAGLNSIREHNGGNAFVGIVHASELVPYDSAVFISTAAMPEQIDLVQDAAITLLKKRIRLYVIWYGDRAISENETQEAVGGVLGEVAVRSGGEILHIVGSESSQEIEGTSTLTLVADAFIGAQEIDIPVDTTLSSLHVKIDAPMRVAVLETPNGDINLRKLVKFKSRIYMMTKDDKRLDSYVPLTKLRKPTVYKLKMVPEYLSHEYTVFVRAERKPDLFLDDMIRRFDRYFLEANSYNPIKFRHNRLQHINGALAASAFMRTHESIKFPQKEPLEFSENNPENGSPKSEVETFSDVELHKTIRDNATLAINKLRSIDILQKGLTTIEMGVNSQILVSPGAMSQLYFEVSNTRTEAIYHTIQVLDERRFLLRLAPQTIFLRPGETITVTVTVLVPSGTPQGTTDRITFTCNGAESATLALNLRVINAFDSKDTTAPSISWSFGNRCDRVTPETTNCAENLWTLDITAQDWETGILRLQSTPAGLIHRNVYTVGSNDPLKATYIATCCEPKVSLIAYDIAGNQRSYNIDVRNFVFTDAVIAAIVLGVLLLILLIALLIAAIVWCCRRRKVTLDLPTYRSHSTRSMD